MNDRKHRWWNFGVVRARSEPSWLLAAQLGVHERVISKAGSSLQFREDSASVVNMSSYSYLGLDEDSRLLAGAIEGLRSAGVLNSSLSRIRMRLQLLDEAEQALGELFDADVGTLPSCSAAAWALLPILASGLLTHGEAPTVVFDSHAHFCLQALKAACADETKVLTIRHNDIERLEALCQAPGQVVYVADSVYSTGGSLAPMNDLIRLQDRYGLWLLLDEAHGTSVVGIKGEGFALDVMGSINDRTFIITSLNKGFGASGGAVLLGDKKSRKNRDVLARHGGPFLWSQRVNAAGLGAIIAAVDIHQGPELDQLQKSLQANISIMDSRLPSALGVGSPLPVRFIKIGDEQKAVELSAQLLALGFYVEPDFFPVVPNNEAGLRVRVRANMSPGEIEAFSSALSSITQVLGSG